MKFRNGFVTNSSSTSFIISTKENLSKESFMLGIGANGNSPMNKLFEDLFSAIENDCEDIQDVVRKSSQYTSTKEFLLSIGFDEETVNKVDALISEGRKVYYGKLRSDGNTISERFFCTESFIICEDDIYFNGSIGGW